MSSRLGALIKLQHSWLISVVGIAGLWWILWAPYGLNSSGLVDEWYMYRLFDTGASWLTLHPANRLGQIVPFYLGYLLTQKSFAGSNIVFMLTFFTKMILSFSVFRYLLRPHTALAFLIATLAAIYPADYGLFHLRYLSYHWVIVTYLLALYMILRWWSRPRPLYILMMMIAQFQCLLSYEVALPLVFATPLIFMWLPKYPKRRVRQAAIFWWVAPCLVVLGLVVLFLRGGAFYQSRILVNSNSDLGWSALSISVHIVRLYLQHFAIAWWLSLTTPLSPALRFLSLLVGGWIGILTYVQLPKLPQAIPARRWIFVGLGVMVLAFMAFLPSEHHRSISERVFLLSSLGAALTLVVCLYRLIKQTKYWRTIFVVSVTILSTIAAFWAFQRHENTSAYSTIEKSILFSITSTMPRWTSERVLVVLLDPTTELATSGEILFGGNDSHYAFNVSLQVVYNSSSVTGVLCFPQTLTWRVERERCEFGAESFTFYGLEGEFLTYPYSQVVVFEYTGTTHLMSTDMLAEEGIYLPLYSPASIIDSSAPLPERAELLTLGLNIGG